MRTTKNPNATTFGTMLAPSRYYRKVILWLVLGCQLLFIQPVASYKICSVEEGGGICPDYSTCCATSTPGVSSCISSKPGEKGACCLDDGLGLTGCKAEYECKNSQQRANLGTRLRSKKDDLYYCHRIDPNYNGTEPKPEKLARYQLITLPDTVLTHVHGLSFRDNNDIVNNVAYFSTMGSLDSSHPEDLQNHQRVTAVLIMVHGSGRTAADYLYGAAASLPKDQQDPKTANMMVLSPWFLDPEDNFTPGNASVVTNEVNQTMMEPDGNNASVPVPLPPRTLRWIEKSPLAPHTWRFGANAIQSNISSFAAIDRMVEKLVTDPVRFPSLQRILVAGHSAGGQFVQRWALLSNSPAWEASSSPQQQVDNLQRNLKKRASSSPSQDNHHQLEQQRSVHIRVIPANPRCFAFLDDRRFVHDPTSHTLVFQRPDDEAIAQCEDYNSWIWGLDAGGNLLAPYKDQAISDAGGAAAMARRYVTQRQVVYLAGEEDLEIFDDDCGSRMQGSTRRERSRQYVSSLMEAYPEEMKHHKNQKRVLVMGSPHDHLLMFQSAEGQQAMFGD